MYKFYEKGPVFCEIVEIYKFLIGILDFRANSCFGHQQWRNLIIPVVFFQRDFSSPLPMVVTAEKGSLVFIVELVSFQYYLVQIQEMLIVPDSHVAVYAVIFLVINPKFKYCHN